MITVKNTQLSKKEQSIITTFFSETFDPYCDFYLTKNNQRLFIRENSEIFFEGIKKGDFIAYDNHGIAAIIGLSDKADRKYLRFLTKDPTKVGSLLVSLLLKYQGVIYTKLKNNNPNIQVLLEFGFVEVASRGEELLLKRDK